MEWAEWVAWWEEWDVSGLVVLVLDSCWNGLYLWSWMCADAEGEYIKPSCRLE